MENKNLTKKEKIKSEEKLASRNRKTLVVHNDDVNTFKKVIFLLRKFCQHDGMQAEQCTLLIHYTGSCDVKSGTPEEMKQIQKQLAENDLTVTIENFS